MTQFKPILFLLFLSISLNAKIILGIAPTEHKKILIKKFKPLAEYLSKETKEKVEIKIGKSYKSVYNDLLKGKIQFAFMGPFISYKAMKKSRYIMPVVKIQRNNSSYHKVAIITKIKSDIKKIRDFNARYFLFGDKLSAGTYFVPRFMLRLKGIKLKNLSKYRFGGSQTNIISAVIRGKVDGGAVSESLAKRYRKKVKIVSLSKNVLNYAISANLKYASRKDMMKIKKSLLKLKDKKILKSLGRDCTGFKRAYKSEYKKLTNLIK